MDKDLKSLQIQLDSLKQEFASKIKAIEDRIWAIQKQHSNDSDDRPQSISRRVERPKSSVIPDPQATTTSFVANSSNHKRTPPPTPSAPLATASRPRKVKSSFIVKYGLNELFLSLFGPFASIIQKFSSVYQHYQSQGKAPVFFMTSAGISALILGFGYLLQFSFSEYLSEVGKVSVAFIIAIAVTFGGIHFTRKHSGMKEFGSSIIGLGIILNYLCTYFSSHYYSIIPTTASLILLAIITACAYVIALLFETRIVAAVSLIGGAFAPVLLGNIEQPPTMYFSYLLLLVVSMLHLSQRIRWQPLAQTSMLLSIALIQYCLIDFPVMLQASMWLVALIHGFFYAFVYFAISDISRSNTVSKITLFVISAALLFLLMTLQQIIADPQTYGVLLIFNTVVWLVCAAYPQQVFVNVNEKITSETKNSMRVLALLSAGVLAGVGILALTDPKFLGLIWGIEGLLLLYLGAHFNYFSIRIESYLILAVSLVQSSFSALIWIADSLAPAPLILQLSIGLGWMNLVVATTLIGTAVTILKKYSQHHKLADKKLYLIANESLSVYMSAIILLSIGVFANQWLWVFAIVPLFLLIFRAKRHSLVFTEYFGFAHYLLFLVPIVVSADQAGSFRFTLQNSIGQFVRIEAFVCLWAIAEFYTRFNPMGRLIRLALVLRQVFYCLIPVFFLPSILRSHIEYFPLVVWGSSLISLFLFYKFKYKALQVETLVLVVLSSITAAIACGFVEFDHWDGYGISGLFVGLAFFGLVLWAWKGFYRKPIGKEPFQLVRRGVQPLFVMSLYYFGLVLFIVLYGFTHSPMLAAALVSAYFAFILITTPVINPLRRNMSAMYLVTWIMVALINISYLIFTLLHAPDIVINSIAVMIAMCAAALLVYLRRSQLTLVWKKLGGQLLHLWIFHLITIFTYVTLIETWFDSNVGPAVSIALVTHATIVLFQTLKIRFQRLIWLASGLYAVAALKIIMFDMHDFSLVEKIIAFMFIGALLLAAAFQYQRMRRTA